MSKRAIFIVASGILLAVLILNTVSSSIQDSKSELLLNEIKRTQKFNANIVMINKFLAQADIFHEIENLTSYKNCNDAKFQDYTTCIALDSVNTIETSQNISNEMEYFYFNDNIIEKIEKKNKSIFWLYFFQYLLLGIAFMGQIFIVLFVKEKDL
ncbi:hypothetical protein KY347_04940 [Candidatus Woesearchaeota archaeon]|nr:hypothetical protein [Candidatus Woesearchaeota archaeon]